MINSVHISDSSIYGSSWTTPELSALFNEQARVHGWLEVMAVLAETQAQFDLIPKQAAIEIRDFYHNVEIDEAFLQEIGQHYAATNHSLMGLIKAVQARCQPLGGEWLCYGATVQDITDTHTMRVLKTVRLQFVEQLNTIEQCLIVLAKQHANTPMAGRTHGQLGLPISFGYKTAVWLDELHRHKRRLVQLAERMDVVQLAGGVGSLSSLGKTPLALQKAFAKALDLNAPFISWTSSRDRYAEWCNVLAMLSATADRIGHEIYNLQRAEIFELSEGFTTGTVGSITMPQKRNPEISEHLGTLARVVRHHAAFMMENLVGDHERDGRSWKGEWLILPEVCLATGKALKLLTTVLSDLQVHQQQMLTNLANANGFIYAEAVMLALAKKCGKQSAHHLVYELTMQAQQQGCDFKSALENDERISAYLSTNEIVELFSLKNSLGACADMVTHVLQVIEANNNND